MTTSLFRALQIQFQRRNRRQSNHSQSNHSQKGFTLIELLIVTLIAGGIISGLMFLVVELLTSDQRDASRNATQQDMRRSIDYIEAELREAVYVYSGRLLAGLHDNLPPSLTASGAGGRSTPVLAFWKQAPLPSNVLDYCSRNWQRPGGVVDRAGEPVPCATGHAYSLIVYSLNTIDDPTWLGRARITRYELRPYTNDTGIPNPTPGYVSPIVGARNLFANWPEGVDGANRQTQRPGGSATPLTDFVDDQAQGAPQCPNNNYQVSPSSAGGQALPDYPYSFYACVFAPTVTPGTPGAPTADAISNQEVFLFLRGNGFGRPSIAEEGNDAFKPALTTRVFNRGTLDVTPRN